MAEQVIQCTECGRIWRGEADWNAVVEGGKAVGVLCPKCQTPEENAEAEINEALLDYGYATDGRGNVRAWGKPKD